MVKLEQLPYNCNKLPIIQVHKYFYTFNKYYKKI